MRICCNSNSNKYWILQTDNSEAKSIESNLYQIKINKDIKDTTGMCWLESNSTTKQLYCKQQKTSTILGEEVKTIIHTLSDFEFSFDKEEITFFSEDNEKFTFKINVFNVNNISTYIFYSSNGNTSTAKYTEADCIGYYYINPLDQNPTWTKSSLKNFVSFYVKDFNNNTSIKKIKIGEAYFVENLQNSNVRENLSYYNIPIESNLMFEALNVKKIGDVIINKLYSNSSNTDTLDNFVIKLITNIDDYKNIEHVTNNDLTDNKLLEQAFFYNLNEKMSLFYNNLELYKEDATTIENIYPNAEDEIRKNYYNFYNLYTPFKKDFNDTLNFFNEYKMWDLLIVSPSKSQTKLSVNLGFNNNFIKNSKNKEIKILDRVSYKIDTRNKIESIINNGTFDCNGGSYLCEFITGATKLGYVNFLAEKISPSTNATLDYNNFLLNENNQNDNRQNTAQTESLNIVIKNLTNTIDENIDNYVTTGNETQSNIQRTVDQTICLSATLIGDKITYDFVNKSDKINKNGNDTDTDIITNGTGVLNISNSIYNINNKEVSFKNAFKTYLNISQNNNEFIFGIQNYDAKKTIVSFDFNVYQFGFMYQTNSGKNYKRFANKLCFIDYDADISENPLNREYILSFKPSALLTETRTTNFYSIRKEGITEENAIFIPFKRITGFYPNKNKEQKISISYEVNPISTIKLTDNFIKNYTKPQENENVFPGSWFNDNKDTSILHPGEITVENESIRINNTYTAYSVFLSDDLVEITPNKYTLNYYAFNKDANNISIKGFVDFSNNTETNTISDWLLKSESIDINNGHTTINGDNLVYQNSSIFNEDDLKKFEINVDNDDSSVYAYDIEKIKFYTEKDNPADLKASDAYNKEWTNFKPIENGYTITTKDDFIHNIFVGLTPNLIKKKIPLFASSVYNNNWYLRDKNIDGTNNDITISIYPNDSYRIVPLYTDDGSETINGLAVEHYHSNINDKNSKKKGNVSDSQIDTNLKIDNLELKEFLFRSYYGANADRNFFTTKFTSDELSDYVDKKYLTASDGIVSKCVAALRKNVTFKLTTNGGWMPSSISKNGLVQKRSNSNYIISNKVVLDKDKSYNDDDIINNEDGIANTLEEITRPNGTVKITANTLMLNTKKESKKERRLGISYDIEYNVPVGTPISNNYYGNNKTIQHVNELINGNLVYQNDLSINEDSYIVNLPQYFEKTAYKWSGYKKSIKNSLQGNITNIEDLNDFTRIIENNVILEATYTPIEYEIYLSYLDKNNKDDSISEALGTELRFFNFEQTLDKNKEDNPAFLPDTSSGTNKVSNFNYKGFILSDGWYTLPEKTKLSNSLTDNDEFLENTFGPKSMLCYCDPQKYNIYFFDTLEPIDVNGEKYYCAASVINDVAYNSYVNIGASIFDTIEENNHTKKYVCTKQFTMSSNNDAQFIDNKNVFNIKEFGDISDIHITDIQYNTESKNVFNPCGNFNTSDKNTIKAKIPNIFLVNEYVDNELSVSVKYFDDNNQTKTYNIVRNVNTDQSEFYDLFNNKSYAENNLKFFNSTAIFKYYRLAYSNDDGSYTYISSDKGIEQFDPNFINNQNFFTFDGHLKINKENIERFYDFINNHRKVFITPIWESYQYNVLFDIGTEKITIPLNSNELYSFTIGSIFKNNEKISEFINENTKIDDKKYRYYCGWADENDTLLYVKNQENVKNLVPLTRETVFKDDSKEISDSLSFKAYFTRRMTNKNGVKFKEGDRFYCEDVKLMLKCINDKGFWDIDKDFGNGF